MLMYKSYLSTIAWLVFVISSIFLTNEGLTRGWSEGAALLLQATTTYIFIAILEISMPFRMQWRWTKDKQVFTDIAHALLTDIVIRNFLLLTTLWFTSLFPNTGEETGLTPSTTLTVMLGIVFLECAEYWRHRMLHKIDCLWVFHALHHHLNRMHILRSGRLHIVDGMSRVLFVFLPAIILDLPHESILWWLILLNAIGPISHSNLNIWTPRVLDHLVSTPAVHRVHHAKSNSLMSSNLAPITPMMDIIFNTWSAPQKNPVIDVGIDPDFFPTNFFGQLLMPLKVIFSKSAD